MLNCDCDALPLLQDAVFPFDARGIAKPLRHAALFAAFEHMRSGATLRFINEHDPQPLLRQLVDRYGGDIHIHYRNQEAGCIVIDFIKQ